MGLSPGTRIGSYEVVSMVAAGGMGEVYRARDSKLGRDVALKVLPATFTTDPDRRERLAREARVLATLNHPHIAAIYGLEEAEGLTALVLEFVEGPTLADRLARGALPIPEAIAVARQIAEALEAAHGKGIVHRDLKPSNIVVQGPPRTVPQVKVLDFGVAKPFVIAGLDTITDSGLHHVEATAAGRILGTPAYMSPEQARGHAVDKRTDVWAFGSVLFEMLSGRRPFEGGTVSDVMARVLEREPEWSALPRHMPEALRTLLQRCLRKDPDKRLHDMADVRIELDELPHSRESGRSSELAHRTGTRAIPWIVAAASALALVATMVNSRRAAAPAQPAARLEVALPPGVEPYIGPSAVAISPDGTRVAFVGIEAGNRQIYFRWIDEFKVVPLRDTSGASAVFFSPDGRSIAFIMTDRTLKKVSLDDGLVVTVTSEADFTTGGTWGSDDRITFGRNKVLWQIPASSGTATQLTTLDTAKGELLHAFPTTVAEGKAILFTTVTSTNRGASHIEALSTEPSASRRYSVAEWGTGPAYAGGGQLLFFRAGALMAAPFDEQALRVTGTARKLIEDLGVTPSGAPMLSVSRTGSVIYTSETASTQLVWISRDGEERPLTTTARHYLNPRVSPDGRRMVVSAASDLWIQDTAGPTFAKLTNETTSGNTYGVWASDHRVVFRTNVGLYSMNSDGSGDLRPLAGTTTADFPNSVSPDGGTLVFLRTTADKGADLYVLSLRGDPAPRSVVSTRAHEGGAQFSPDGKWLAYSSDESGQFQVFVSPYPALDRKWPVSPAGKYAIWNRNSRELFYRDGTRTVAATMTVTNSVPVFSSRVLFDRQYDFGPGQTVANYDVSADGQRFVMVKRHSASTRLSVVLNALDGTRVAPER